MISIALTLRPNGSMTLPKKLRSKYKTPHYIAQEVAGGIFLKPVEEIEYYEEEDGSAGLRFPYGMDGGKLADMMDTVNERLDAEEKTKKPKRSKKRHG